MNFALFGDGKMGTALRLSAARDGHRIVAAVTRSGIEGDLRAAGVAIDFSHADALDGHLSLAEEFRLPLVIGTTGWNDRRDAVRRRVEAAGLGVVHAPNFSLGVNLFFRLAARAAEVFAPFAYDPFITEAHHRHKRDAPSGTAIALRGILQSAFQTDIPTSSLRAGAIPGTHTVGFDGDADTLTITHTARHRGGFADGALLAAEWIVGKTGFFEFSRVLDDRLEEVGGRQ